MFHIQVEGKQKKMFDVQFIFDEPCEKVTFVLKPLQFLNKRVQLKQKEFSRQYMNKILDAKVIYEPNMKELPCLPNVESLDCSHCYLEKLPEMKNLNVLNCSFNLLDSIPNFPNLRILHCLTNWRIKEIPVFHLLEKLFLASTKVEVISTMNNLKVLQVMNCTELQRIENQPVLLSLVIYDCPNLSFVGDTPALQYRNDY